MTDRESERDRERNRERESEREKIKESEGKNCQDPLSISSFPSRR